MFYNIYVTIASVDVIITLTASEFIKYWYNNCYIYLKFLLSIFYFYCKDT